MKMSTSTIPKTSPSSSDNFNNSHLKIRQLESQSKFNVTTVTILVVDRKASLAIEKVDDSKESFIEAVGFSTYSTSQPTVISYLSIFENFWNQLELYEQLKAHDKIQNEFINIASHEIKTPTQAILGYSNLIQRHPEKQEEMLQGISRNATRLQRLTNDILDVTRIESQSLRLNLERFNLSDAISDVVQDYRGEIEKSNSGIQLLYNSYFDNQNNPLFIEGDRGRIIQVISNLVSNGIKFTNKGGSILITEEERIVDNHNQIVVSIKDSGRGVDPELMPKLFSKFVAKSEKGIGLGLFISKNIVEAHGGKIWVQNNDSGPNTGGATFTFSLPSVRPGRIR
jgi:signal transduction histidine kinase